MQMSLDLVSICHINIAWCAEFGRFVVISYLYWTVPKSSISRQSDGPDGKIWSSISVMRLQQNENATVEYRKRKFMYTNKIGKLESRTFKSISYFDKQRSDDSKLTQCRHILGGVVLRFLHQSADSLEILTLSITQ